MQTISFERNDPGKISQADEQEREYNRAKEAIEKEYQVAEDRCAKVVIKLFAHRL